MEFMAEPQEFSDVQSFVGAFSYWSEITGGKKILFVSACNENASEICMKKIKMPVVTCTDLNEFGVTEIKVYELSYI